MAYKPDDVGGMTIGDRCDHLCHQFSIYWFNIDFKRFQFVNWLGLVDQLWPQLTLKWPIDPHISLLKFFNIPHQLAEIILRCMFNDFSSRQMKRFYLKEITLKIYI